MDWTAAQASAIRVPSGNLSYFSELYMDNMEIGNPALEGGREGLFEDSMRATQ